MEGLLAKAWARCKDGSISVPCPELAPWGHGPSRAWQRGRGGETGCGFGEREDAGEINSPTAVFPGPGSDQLRSFWSSGLTIANSIDNRCPFI